MKYIDIKKQRNKKIMEKTNQGSKYGSIIIFAFIAVLAVIGFLYRNKIGAMFNPISIVGGITSAELKETDGRTNIMILGSDQRDAGAESGRNVLTDTILIASIGKADKDVVLMSIPRDLWVQRPNGGFSKINAVYAYDGPEGLKKTIEQVLGIKVHYYSMVSFDLFKEVIDILGGIEVNVENAFTDSQYPIEGKENDPIYANRYETIHFDKGNVKMDGITALKFVRSRHGDGVEGTDFARARRQQAVIAAIKKNALNIQTLVNPIKLKDLYDAYAKNVATDIDFKTLQGFYLIAQQVDFSRIVSVVLDDRSTPDQGGLLYNPQDATLYGGQYVLLPKTGDYSQIHAFVQKYLFGNK